MKCNRSTVIRLRFLGDNFVGIVYRITCSTEDESRTKSLFLKIAPSDPTKRKIVPVRKFFVRESYMYNVVSVYFFMDFLQLKICKK